MPVIIRPARPDDAEQVLAMGRLLNTHVRAPRPDLTEARFLADGFGPAARFSALVAQGEGRLDGYAISMPAYDYDRGAHGRFMHDLFVHPDRRRRGIARALLNGVAQAVRDEGGDFIWWVSFRLNREARGFYDSLARDLRDLDVWKLDAAGLTRMLSSPS
jgi:GNAT superfamily N-acetyltransferase